jgi:ferredoxin
MDKITIDNSLYSYRDGSEVPNGDGYHPHLSTRFRNRCLAKRPDMLPELYRNRSECSGCTACMAVCPTESITMEPDEEGFEYPIVDAATCVGCGKCMRICPFKERIIR